jgi:hypothetical protein
MAIYDSPSLGNMTGTNLNSACKHIQQCKVSLDHFLFWANETDLEKDKMRYCAHKDEMTVGIGRPWDSSSVKHPPSAYPPVVTNLGDIMKSDEHYLVPRMMLIFLYHTARDVVHRQEIINNIKNQDGGFRTKGDNLSLSKHYFRKEGGETFYDTSKYLSRMFDYYPVGMCNTIAYASPRTGDTVGSFMIGGLRTVMNGDWEVHAGDLLQWYWTFERDCFRKDGTRKSYMSFRDGRVVVEAFGMSPFEDLRDEVHAESGELPARDGVESSAKKAKTDHKHTMANNRRNFNDRQYGIKPQSLTPSEKSKSVARIKRYIQSHQCPNLYDRTRVFARAIGTARAGEALDIQIGRQSM